MERSEQVGQATGYYGGREDVVSAERPQGVHRAIGMLDTNVEILAKILAQFEERLNVAGVLRPDAPSVREAGGINPVQPSMCSMADVLTGAAARVRTNADRLNALLGRLDL